MPDDLSIEALFQMNINKAFTCCFTGHRPHKLPYHPETGGPAADRLQSRLKKEIILAVDQGYKYFVCGGGLGIDMLAAKMVLSLKAEFPFLHLSLALPCQNHTDRWTAAQKQDMNALMEQADKVYYVTQGPYTEGCMQKRNRYMIDISSRIIAVFNGTSGGTKLTLDYAEKSYIQIVLVDCK